VKTLGIVGGIGPESTIDYYRLILAGHRERAGHAHAPSLLIDSVDLERALEFLNAGDDAGLAEYFGASLQRLARGGAQTALLAANTAHLVIDALRAASPVPLLSIVEATVDRARIAGHRRLALLGTRFTMRARFYADAFEQAGMELLTPNDEEQAFIHQKYFAELVPGVFLPQTRDAIAAIIARMQRDHALDAVVLAGTELPLLLREAQLELPLLDTTRIHVDVALDWLLAP
jgi:aspartate racemase